MVDALLHVITRQRPEIPGDSSLDRLINSDERALALTGSSAKQYNILDNLCFKGGGIMALKYASKPVPSIILSALTVEAAGVLQSGETSMDDPWEGLFKWGDEFRTATGITPEDIDRAIAEVRRARRS